MKVSKRACQYALNIIVCLAIILPAIALTSGCTVVINSHDVSTAAEGTNALLGGL